MQPNKEKYEELKVEGVKKYTGISISSTSRNSSLGSINLQDLKPRDPPTPPPPPQAREMSWNEILFLIFVKIYFNLSCKSDLLSTTNNFFYGIFVKYFPANPSKPSLLSVCIEKLNADLH